MTSDSSRDPGKAEILPPRAVSRDTLHPRLGRVGSAFSNENLDTLSRLLDTWFRVPGTSIRFGLDGIIGFVPGIGDFAGGLASCVIIVAAYVRGLPLVTVTRMIANVGIEVVVGAVPLLGNFFDIAWRANRRNYALLERSLEAGHRDSWRDWLVVGLMIVAIMVMVMLPFVLVVWAVRSLFGPHVHWL